MRIAPGVWRVRPRASDSALITIRGDSITVDFSGATLAGIPDTADPDEASGVAIRVEGGRAVGVVNATVRGWKIGLLAVGTRGLAVLGGDYSYNWKPRLFSLVEHESLADWLSFHHNEHGEWRRFGGAIVLEDVRGGAVIGVTARQGMNALMMVRTDSMNVEGNNFSFNSGLGIGMYRSSDNVVVHNRADYDVRGFSEGFYHRGQDSADILMFEQCSRNVVAFNSFTHGGDGVFLWAGQSTMDSGQGGANDNWFFKNDASFSPANGIEATFSRNVFAGNLLQGNDYGVWGGYSYSSFIIANRFVSNRTGIAIEHGQDNAIAGNRFDGDTTAIWLWGDPIAPSDWGYPRFRDTRSRDYAIEHNQFIGNRVALRIRQTSGAAIGGSRLTRVDTLLAIRDSTVVAVRDTATVPRPAGMPALPTRDAGAAATPAMPASLSADSASHPPASEAAEYPRSAIVVDEWGPYDYRSPKLWPIDSARAVPLRLRVLGPRGRWRVTARRGVSAVSATAGNVGDTITVTPSEPGDWRLDLSYAGAATTSPRGRGSRAGASVPFSYGRFEPAQEWSVKFFAYGDSAVMANDTAAFERGMPVLERHAPRLDDMWYRPPRDLAAVPGDKFAVSARSVVTLPAGRYTIRTISDDGVRVWVDGRLVIDDWNVHESKVDHAALAGGRHEIVVRYFQLGGWAELRLDIVRGVETSSGSPGPH